MVKRLEIPGINPETLEVTDPKLSPSVFRKILKSQGKSAKDVQKAMQAMDKAGDARSEVNGHEQTKPDGTPYDKWD
jgi:hypothetical protein